ncbi:unnamed protein product, partial [Laminaria digitata]
GGGASADVAAVTKRSDGVSATATSRFDAAWVASGLAGLGVASVLDAAGVPSSVLDDAGVPSKIGLGEAGVPSSVLDDVGVPSSVLDAAGVPSSVLDVAGVPPSVLDEAGVLSKLGSRGEVISARGLSWKEKQREKKVAAAAAAAAGVVPGKGKKKRGQERNFDHSRWRKRTVAFQLMYEGEGYAGFCSQSEGDEDTVEKRLFHALTTTKLVERIATGDNYSRCGRTDRGVSALGNV